MNQKSVYHSKFFRSAAAFLLLICLLLPVFGAARAEGGEEAADLTGACAFVLPERSMAFDARLTDGRYNSRISFKKEEAIEIALADGAEGLYVAWYEYPESARIETLDKAGAVLESKAANADLLNEYFALPQGCAAVRIAGDKAFSVCELRVFDAAAPPENLCVMAAQQTQPKAMLIAAHTSDEAYDFGSLLPFFCGGDAAIVFLSSESRQAQQQAIENLYALGSRTQPVFGNFQYYRTVLEVKRMYGLIDKADLSNWLIQLLRRYRPDTLITHSALGEGGDGMHLLAATHVPLAAAQAADESKEYVSERLYGVWQVRAVYQHLESGGCPLYDTGAPISAFGGMSALELAQEAFDRYTTYQVFRALVTDTPYFIQTFPEDIAATEAESAKELYALLSSLSGPEALPSAAVTPEPTATPEPQPTADAAEARENENESADIANDWMYSQTGYAIGAGLTALGIAVIMLCLFRRGREPEKKRTSLRVAGAVAGGLLVLFGAALILRANTPAATPEPEITPVPQPTVTATVHEETPTPVPTPTADPFAAHFRQEGEPEEVVVFDYENGVFEYRNDTLGIEIRRITSTDPMLAYYVAHIYERDVDSYRSGFGSARQNGRDPVDACTMARRYSAVFGITGDNLLHSDYNRGLMIRDGRVFRAMTQQSAMALTDDFSMRIYSAKDETMLNEIEEGTRDTFAFGPPLIVDGVISADIEQSRVSRINPRAGLGLVEPGHFVAIVVDGRLPRYSHGVLLPEFAQMFLDEGCVMAYNLDGGASATMVFMGEYINIRAENHYRSVPDQLLWGYSELVPGEDEPRLYAGLVPQGWSPEA